MVNTPNTTKSKVSMTVHVSKSAQSTLKTVKSIFECRTLGNAVETLTGMVSTKDILTKRMELEGMNVIVGTKLEQVETVSDNDITQCGISDEEIHTMWIGVFTKKIQSEAKSYGIEDIPTEDMIKELEKDVIVEYYMMKLMEKSMKPTISPAGEMPDMAYLDEMDAKEERKV